MLVIRFLRIGKKNQPFFRIVVTDKKNPPQGGRFLEALGFLNPLTKEKKLNKERIKYWLGVGAQPSDSLYNLLIEEKIIKGEKRDVHKKPKEEKPEEEKPKEEKKEKLEEEKPKPKKEPEKEKTK